MKSGFIAVFFMGLLVLSGCANEAKEDRTTASVLEKAPYKGISDSIAKNPDDAALYLRRSNLLTINDELSLAYSDLKKAWVLAPSESTAELLVNNLFMVGKNREAVNFLKEMTNTYPENELFKRRLSEAQMNSGNVSGAINSYEKIIQDDSTDFEAWYEKGLLFLEQKDTAQAILDLETSYRLQPLQLTALTLANIYSETKNPRCLVLVDRVIAKDSLMEMADPYFIKGIYYVNTGNSAKAMELFNMVIRINWKFQEAYLEKGMLFYQAKNLDEALQQFKLAATVSNTYPEAYYWQGKCYEALGMKEEAQANYLRAYSLDKGFSEAVEAAKRLEGNLNN